MNFNCTSLQYYSIVIVMRKEQCYSFELLDADQLKTHQPVSSRSQQISPWVECFINNRPHPKNLTYEFHDEEASCAQLTEDNKKRVDFLASLYQKVESKRKKFRTLVQKFQSLDDQESIRLMAVTKERREQLNAKQIKQQPFQKYAKIQINQHSQGSQLKGKKILGTTMYVYQSEQPRKLGRITRNTRGAGFEYRTETGKQNASNSCEKFDTEGGYGSKNLQKILKMKEKIRVRNNSLVKKMKQASKNSSKQLSAREERPQKLGCRDWKSITLYYERSHEKLSTLAVGRPKMKPNQKIMHHEFELKRNVTVDFFNE